MFVLCFAGKGHWKSFSNAIMQGRILIRIAAPVGSCIVWCSESVRQGERSARGKVDAKATVVVVMIFLFKYAFVQALVSSGNWSDCFWAECLHALMQPTLGCGYAHGVTRVFALCLAGKGH